MEKEIIAFRWSRYVKIITLIVGLVILGSVVLIFYKINHPLSQLFLGLIMFASVSYFVLKTPRSLVLDTNAVIIRHLYGSSIFEISDILSAKPLERKIVNKSSRLIGSSGFFGYQGLFRSSEIGKYKIYATELNNLVQLSTVNGIFVFSSTNSLRVSGIINSLIKKTQ